MLVDKWACRLRMALRAGRILRRTFLQQAVVERPVWIVAVTAL